MESHDMPNPDQSAAAKKGRRRAAAVQILAGVVVGLALLAAYFLLPLDLFAGWPAWLTLTSGVILLGVVTVLQVRSVVRSTSPAARAAGALMQSIPFFLLLFAAEYYVLAAGDPGIFNQPDLTRMDMLYFTVTVFATVGFGDIVATGQMVRGMVTAQMILDLIVIGAVFKLFLGAVQIARGEQPSPRPPAGGQVHPPA